VKYVTQTIELIVAAADTMAAFAQELAALERHL
jgi:hypothetical protein